MCSPGKSVPPNTFVISVPQTGITRVRSFPQICVSIFKAHTCMILTVTEGFIFFIQAPQEWMKANTKAFLNYTMFDTKKDGIEIMVFFTRCYFLEPSSCWSTA